MKRKHILVFLSLIPGVQAQRTAADISIRLIRATPTQAVFSYTAPDSNACQVQEGTDPRFTTVDHDVDPKLFPGSNLDTRPGNIVDGASRVIVIGFRGTGLAADGKIYSRALQASTTHYLKISCSDGRTGVLRFSTVEPAFGNTAPDYIPYNTAGFGNYGWPTINYNAPTYDVASNTIIDPLTGVQLQRWTGPGDGGGLITGWGSYGGVIDSKQAWINPSSLLDKSGFSTYSGSGGASDALFLWGPSGVYRPSFTSTEFFAMDDFQIRFNAYSTNPGATVSVCLVYDGGAGSADSDCIGKTLRIAVPQRTPSVLTIPSTWPQPILGGWGSPLVSNDMLTNSFTGNLAAVNGSSVVWGSNAAWSPGQSYYFPTSILRRGMLIGIAGSAPICPNNLCTIASVEDEQHLTIAQSLPGWNGETTVATSAIAAGATEIPVQSSDGFLFDSWPNNGGTFGGIIIDTGNNAETISCKSLAGNTLRGCSNITKNHDSGVAVSQKMYSFPNWGVKLWADPNGGSVYIGGAENNWAISNNFFTEYQGAGTTGCDGIPHPVKFAADGVTPLSAPVTGYLCTFVDDFFSNQGNSYLYLLLPATGETRKLTNFINGASLGYGYNTSTGFIQNCVYNDNPSDPSSQKFAAWDDQRNSSPVNPAFKCTPLQTTQTVQQQISAKYPQIDFSYFGPPALQDFQYPFAKFMMRPQQGAMAWFCDLDVSQPPGPAQVQTCHNSWDTYPARFAGVHGFEFFEIPGSSYPKGSSDMYSITGLAAPGVARLEQWDVAVKQIANNGGSLALSATFTDPQTCEQLGVTDPRWIAMGATGKRCIQLDVGDPVATQPAPQDLKPLGTLPTGARPAPWPHNAASCGGDGSTTNCYSYLQPLQPGDFLVDLRAGAREAMLVAQVTPVQNDPAVTAHIVVARGIQHSPNDCAAPQNHAAGFVLTAWLPMNCYYPGFILFPNGDVSQGLSDDATLKAGHVIEWWLGADLLTVGPYVVSFGDKLGGYGTGYGVRVGQPLSVWGSGFSWGVQSMFPFDGSFHGVGIGIVQSHPGGLTSACPDCRWILDGRPLGGAGGGASQLWDHTYSRVAGTNNIYRLDLPHNQNTSLDLKRQSVRMWAGAHLIQNISGPGSQLSDAKPWQGCIAMLPDECVAGSQPGEIFEVVPSATISRGCQIDMTINTPCVAPMGPHVAAYTQHLISGADPNGRNGRVLTMALGGPGRTNNYANIHALNTGDWGVTAVAWGDGRRSDVWGVRLPPLSRFSADVNNSIDRTTFIHIPVTIPQSDDDSSAARIRFGYAEFGANAMGQPLFCSPNRLEDCTTAPANGDPFAFASEPQNWTPCGQGCTVSIPALSQRVLYYVIDRKLSDGSIQTGPLQVVAVE